MIQQAEQNPGASRDAILVVNLPWVFHFEMFCLLQWMNRVESSVLYLLDDKAAEIAAGQEVGERGAECRVLHLWEAAGLCSVP